MARAYQTKPSLPEQDQDAGHVEMDCPKLGLDFRQRFASRDKIAAPGALDPVLLTSVNSCHRSQFRWTQSRHTGCDVQPRPGQGARQAFGQRCRLRDQAQSDPGRRRSSSGR